MIGKLAKLPAKRKDVMHLLNLNLVVLINYKL